MKKSSIFTVMTLVLGLGLSVSCAHHEHGGKEHGGKEHGGKAKCSKDQKSNECQAKTKKKGANLRSSFRKVSVKDIKDALTSYIASNSDKNGIYNYTDRDREDKKLQLKFVKIHDPVRVMKKRGQFFACTDFQIVGKSGKLHDLDFWLTPTDTGLKVVQTKVHKDPIKKKKTWIKVPRYTFKGEEIIPL